MFDAKLVVDGSSERLTPKELRAALKAILDCRKGSKMRVMDMQAHSFWREGMSYAEIGKIMGITSRRAKAAVGRVESGRYGDTW